jgi:rhodanese-related sulfurtransferase
MKNKWVVLLLLLAGVYIFGKQGLSGGPEITVSELANLMKGDPRPVLIDVRERVQYDQGHLPGAISVPFEEFKARVESLKLPKDDVVVLYGADDTRVRETTKHLYQSGYHGGLTLKGGIEAWKAAGQTVAKPPPSAK